MEETTEVTIPGVQEGHPPEAENRGRPGQLDNGQLPGQTTGSRKQGDQEGGGEKAGDDASEPIADSGALGGESQRRLVDEGPSLLIQRQGHTNPAASPEDGAETLTSGDEPKANNASA